MMRKVLLVTLLSLAMMGSAVARKEVDNLRYFIDPRTNLCFAWHGYGTTQTMSMVPCTAEVLAIINR